MFFICVFVEEQKCLPLTESNSMDLPVESWSGGFYCRVANLACSGGSTRSLFVECPVHHRQLPAARAARWLSRGGRRPSSPGGLLSFRVRPPAASSAAPPGSLTFCMPRLFPGSCVFWGPVSVPRSGSPFPLTAPEQAGKSDCDLVLAGGLEGLATGDLAAVQRLVFLT